MGKEITADLMQTDYKDFKSPRWGLIEIGRGRWVKRFKVSVHELREPKPTKNERINKVGYIRLEPVE